MRGGPRSRPPQSLSPPRATPTQSSRLEVERLGDELAVIGRVAKRHLGRLGSLEVEVHIVFPRETNPTVYLDTVTCDLSIRVGDIRLRHRRGQGAVGGIRVDGP